MRLYFGNSRGEKMPNRKGTRTAKGEGSIRLRADGRLEARVTLGFKDGKRITKSVYAHSEQEIVAAKNKLLAQYGLGVALGDKSTVTQMLLEWLEYKSATVKPTTHTSYTFQVNKHLIPRIGKLLVQKLEPEHLDRMYRDMRKKGLNHNTIRIAHAVMHGSLERLRRRRKVAENVASLVDELPRDAVKFEARAWTADEARAFLGAVQDDRLFALYWLALTGSFRRGELLGLKWSAISLEQHPRHGQYVVIRIVNNRTQSGNKVLELEPKTHRSKRPVILPYKAWEVLQAHKAKVEVERQGLAEKGHTPQDEGYVFVSPYLEPWHPSNFYNREWLPLLKKAGVPPIRFHDLRHTNITLDLATGGDLKTASQRAGHSTVTFTANVYQHPDLEQQLEATSRMAEILAPTQRNPKTRLN